MHHINEHNGKFIFSQNLKQRLKSEIKGNVHFHLQDDTLIVDISATHNVYWKYIHNNLSSELVQGLTSEMLSEAIVKQYTKFIRNLYFF